MDPTQISRAVDESNASRSSLMVTQNPTLPQGFHARSQGPLSGLPRNPIHNGSPGGPRLGSRPPPDLHHLDSRSNLISSASLPNQFIQQRPSFGPPRPQVIPTASPGNFPRAPSPSTNLPTQPPPLRYLNPTPSSNIRGPPPYPSPGQRPPFNPNSQQFLRPQRPAIFETGGATPFYTRSSIYSHTTDNRQVTPRLISETIVVEQQNNDGPLKIIKTTTAIKNHNTQQSSQINQQSKEIMDNNEQQLNVNVFNKDQMKSNNDDDNDDDDVIMDVEKDFTSTIDHQLNTTSYKSGTLNISTPIPSPDHKLIHDEQTDSSRNIINSPQTKSEFIFNTQIFESQIDNNPQNLNNESENNSTVNKSNISEDDINKLEKSASIQSREKTPDILTTSSISVSLAPSPDPTTDVMGYDNGKLRSLSPKSIKSPSPDINPISPIIPNTPKKIINNIKADSSENIDDLNDITEQISEMQVTTPVKKKFSTTRVQTPKSSMKLSTSQRSLKSDGDKDHGTNSTAPETAPTTNGVAISPTKKLPTKLRDGDKSKSAGSPIKSPSKSIKSLPRTPESGPPTSIEKKKVPMNKVQVGAAPSPNLKTVRSKIGSLDNTSYKPGGGKVKIENRKLDFSKAQPKIAAKNDKYAPSGGDKKITQVKLQWNAKPKVGSLDNATHKPGGGDKKIETVKLDFKDKAKPKVGSKDNAKHIPGGGAVKSTVIPPKTSQELSNIIETQKIDIKAESKIGSMDNVKHKPGGGDKKIFNDKEYLRQMGTNVESINGSGAQSPAPSTDSKNGLPTSDENLNQEL